MSKILAVVICLLAFWAIEIFLHFRTPRGGGPC